MKQTIDFVITWVDGNDPEWQHSKSKYSAKVKDTNQDNLFDTWNNNPIRYRDWENLQYWFRSVEKYAPWVNKIHFVTWGHLPKWLNINNPKLHIVEHKDFIPEIYLPTFNSHTIEWNFHRIPGLAEQFVYFNDDMFITHKVKETDFFRNGLPCEIATLDCVALDWDMGHAEIQNTKILNKYFVKKKQILKNWRKWLVPKYGKHLIKTFMLFPWNQFTGLNESHLPVSHLKSMFKFIWEKEPQLIHDTCMAKFREDFNVNHWLIKNWNIIEGNFSPRASKIGRSFYKPVDDEICNLIIKEKYKLICINDCICTEEEFEKQKDMLLRAFCKILPEKSSFEK